MDTNTITLDREQVDAQICELDGQIAEGELRLATLQAEVERLRGRRDVWVMLRGALQERED